MFKFLTGTLFAILLALFSTDTVAQLSPPTLHPAAPIAGDHVAINSLGGPCLGYLMFPGPIVIRTGNAILVRASTYDAFGVCAGGAAMLSVPIGVFSAGSYTVRLEGIDATPGSLIINPNPVLIGELPFEVQGVFTAAPVPATGPVAAAFTAFLFLMLAVLSIRRLRARPLPARHGGDHAG